MLGNCDQMLLVPPPTTNQWPHQNQIHQIDDGKVSMASSGNNKVMEKPGGTTQDLQAQQQQQQQQALNCPRCDSSNTKFCYYNNYSLSQPRHFCKACKRYWTRGGTLRNVPVGGGCRKNKRVFKRPTNINDTTGTSTSTSAAVSSSSASSPSAPSSASSSQLPQIDTASTSNHISPVFYGLPASNSCDVNLLPFSRLFNSRIISGSSGYGLHHHQPPQLNNNGIGLGFSSGFMSSTEASTTDNGYRNNGFTSNNTTFLSGYDSIFTSSSCASSTTVVPSLLSSKFFNEGVKDGSGGNPFLQGLGAPVEEDLQRASSNGTTEAGVVGLKGVVKVEGQNRLEYWNGSACQNQNMEHVGLYDPSLYNWNTAASALGTVWNDQPNIGPSVTSLI